MAEGAPSGTDADRLQALLRGHVPALDGVRGCAIVLLLMHQLLLDVEPASRPLQIVELCLQLGWSGVQLFFVLSGFLITGILSDTRGREGYFRAFYMRRVLRIFPLYYLTLITVAFILPRIASVPTWLTADPSRLSLHWVYLSNWRHDGPGVLAHTWSLAVEEQFYFVWPLVIALLPPRWALRLCFALAVVSLGARIAWRVAGLEPEDMYTFTFARMDALALGAAVALALRDPSIAAWLAPRARKLLALFGGLLAALLVMTRGLARAGLRTQTAGYSLLAIVGALLVAVLVVDTSRGGSRLTSALAWKPLREAGKYSYAIYVLHLPVHSLLSRVILAKWLVIGNDRQWAIVQPLYMIGVAALLFVLARISYVLIEQPFLKLKRYFRAA